MNSTYFQPALSARLAIALLMTAAADFLLFKQPVGLSLVLFASLLSIAILAAHPRAIRRGMTAKVCLAVAGIVPLLENISALSVSVAVIGLSAFALSVSGRLRSGLAQAAGQIPRFLLSIPLRLPRDLARSRQISKRIGRNKLRPAGIVVSQ